MIAPGLASMDWVRQNGHFRSSGILDINFQSTNCGCDLNTATLVVAV
jgi:hypothetical protein